MTHAIERAARRAARSAVLRSGLAAFVATIVALVVAAGAAAHGETFFQLGTDRIQPGGQVEVRADLGAGDAFQITLIAKADGARRELGVVPATEEGHLQTYLTIPADVPAGDYLMEIAWDLTVLRAPLTVAGAPIDDGQGRQPGQDEGFGAAPSAAAGGVVPGTASSAPAGSVAPSVGVRGRRDSVEGLGIVAIAAVAAIVLLGGLRLVRRPARPAP